MFLKMAHRDGKNSSSCVIESLEEEQKKISDLLALEKWLDENPYDHGAIPENLICALFLESEYKAVHGKQQSLKKKIELAEADANPLLLKTLSDGTVNTKPLLLNGEGDGISAPNTLVSPFSGGSVVQFGGAGAMAHVPPTNGGDQSMATINYLLLNANLLQIQGVKLQMQGVKNLEKIYDGMNRMGEATKTAGDSIVAEIQELTKFQRGLDERTRVEKTEKDSKTAAGLRFWWSIYVSLFFAFFTLLLLKWSSIASYFPESRCLKWLLPNLDNGGAEGTKAYRFLGWEWGWGGGLKAWSYLNSFLPAAQAIQAGSCIWQWVCFLLPLILIGKLPWMLSSVLLVCLPFFIVDAGFRLIVLPVILLFILWAVHYLSAYAVPWRLSAPFSTFLCYVLSIVAGFVAGALMADETPWFAIWKLCNVWPASSDFSKVAFDYAKIMW